MTVQWTLVALFLYLELAFVFLLMLPIIPPKVWQYVFYSRICRVVSSKANVYFVVFIIVLIFFFLDSIREMMKYSSSTSIDLGQEIITHMKLFRSQRNFYISGMTVFLWLVCRRLVMLTLCEAELIAENESQMKRAQNATETVEKILKKREEVAEEKSAITQVSEAEAVELRQAVENTRNELEETRREIEEMKLKSLAVTKEYEELLARHTALQSKAGE